MHYGLASGSIYFLSRDPAVSTTLSPYGYVAGNPLNATDPSGLCDWWNVICDAGSVGGAVVGAAGTVVHAASSAVSTVTGAAGDVLHGALDIAATYPYAAYYASYQAAHFINGVGSHLGVPGSIVSHILALPFAIPQAEGLSGDATLDWIKGHTVNNESVCDEGVVGGILPRFILGGGPKTYLPGIHANGSIDFEW